eukprot:c32137_g1_i1.p1 GENE.c32137_g1_i1~~c32137_g1_i1.p1  ORF type:complete len:172 (-),score=9.03 c32137_g1_i1:49-564(-)
MMSAQPQAASLEAALSTSSTTPIASTWAASRLHSTKLSVRVPDAKDDHNGTNTRSIYLSSSCSSEGEEGTHSDSLFEVGLLSDTFPSVSEDLSAFALELPCPPARCPEPASIPTPAGRVAVTVRVTVARVMHVRHEGPDPRLDLDLVTVVPRGVRANVGTRRTLVGQWFGA